MHRSLRKPLVRMNDRFGRSFGFKLRKVPYSRPSTIKAKAIFGNRPIRVVEIGSAAGNNALDILRQLNVTQYIAVDPYDGADSGYQDYNRGRLALMREQARKRLARYTPKVVWIYQESSKAIGQLEGPFDFVYIDGNHSYSAVLSDMNNYYEILGDRFVLGGHDVDRPGVAKAFVEFVSTKSIGSYEIRDPDWIVYNE